MIGAALLSAANGWAGVVVHGAVRDAMEIDDAAIGVRALGLCPRRSIKRGQGQRDAMLTFCGVTIAAGAWLYADRDGMLVSARALSWR